MSRPLRARCPAALLALTLTLAVTLAGCNRQPASARIVVGTWEAQAVASPAAPLPPGVTPTPFPFGTPFAAASPPASPAATPLGSPVADNRVSATLARDVGPNGEPVDPSTTFPPDSARIYLVFHTTGLPADSHLEAVWIAEDVHAPVPQNYEVTRSTITIAGNQVGNFSVAKPPAGFPAGQYRTDLFLDGNLIGTFPFTVG